MTWYKFGIRKYLKETYIQAIFPMLFALALLLWHFYSGAKYEWHAIEPISQPDIFVRLFYSALVFVTLGYLLYLIRFYQLLYIVFVKFLGDFRTFKEIKSVIWIALMGLMYFKIVPFFVDLLNGILSIGYNALGLILYAMPAFGISLILFVMILIAYAHYNDRKTSPTDR